MANKKVQDDLLVYFDNKLGDSKEAASFAKEDCANELSCTDDEISQALDALIREGYVQANEDGNNIVVESITSKGFERLEEI